MKKNIIHLIFYSSIFFPIAVFSGDKQEIAVQVDTNDMIVSPETFVELLRSVLEAEHGNYAKQMNDVLMKLLQANSSMNQILTQDTANAAQKLSEMIIAAQPKLIGRRISSMLRKMALIAVPWNNIIGTFSPLNAIGPDDLDIINQVVDSAEEIEGQMSEEPECTSKTVKDKVSSGLKKMLQGIGSAVGFVGQQVDDGINLVITPLVQGVQKVTGKKTFDEEDVERFLKENNEEFNKLFKTYMDKIIDTLKISYRDTLTDAQRNAVSKALLNFQNKLSKNLKPNTLVSNALLTKVQQEEAEDASKDNKCDLELQTALSILFNPQGTKVQTPQLEAPVKTTQSKSIRTKQLQIDANNSKIGDLFNEALKTLNEIKTLDKKSYLTAHTSIKNMLQNLLKKLSVDEQKTNTYTPVVNKTT